VDYKSLKVATELQTLIKIFTDKASIGRFGDGELRVCIRGKIKSQDYDVQLRKRLIEVLTTDLDGFLVGIPRVYGRKDDYDAKRHWERFFKKQNGFHKYLDTSKQYYSAFISRMESSPQLRLKTYWTLGKLIWQNKDVLVVEGDHYQFTDASKRTDLLDGCKTVTTLLGPRKNAFGRYDRIFKAICTHPKSTIILLSLGATATVLAYDLHKAGYQALDLGKTNNIHLPVL
jgi:glycosyltransferase family protein